MSEQHIGAPEQEWKSDVSDAALQGSMSHLRENLEREKALVQRYRYMHREAEQDLLAFRRHTNVQIRSMNKALARQIEKFELLNQQLGVQERTHNQALEAQQKDYEHRCDEMQKRHAAECEAMQMAFDDLALRYDATIPALDAAKADFATQKMRGDSSEELLKKARDRCKSLEAALRRQKVIFAMEMSKQRMLEILILPKRSPKRKSFFEAQKLACAELEGAGLFDAAWYLETYPDIATFKLPPLKHYVQYGCFEARNPSSKFNTLSYYLEHPEVADRGECALLDFLHKTTD